MAQKLNVLMIDDHALILEGYKTVLNDFSEKEAIDLEIDSVLNCDDALHLIKNSHVSYDFVFLDIGLPPSRDGKILSGEDLGKVIQEQFPDSKIIVLTMFSDSLRLISILKNLSPDGFLIKSEIDPQEFLKAFVEVRNGGKCFSPFIIRLLQKQVTSDIILDQNDRQILFHLSSGVRTKDLVDKLPLSLASIEKRKRVLKEKFGVEGEGDLALINSAKNNGFL